MTWEVLDANRAERTDRRMMLVAGSRRYQDKNEP